MRSRRAAIAPAVAALCLVGLSARPATAGFTETLQRGMFLIDGSFVMATLDSRWDDGGAEASLIEPIERYEPGGGWQGTITAKPEAEYMLWVTRVQYGILDSLSLGIGIPVVIRTTVDPKLGWKPGDYQSNLGRPYTETDFWEWAASMGQGKPGSWSGNEGALGDIVLGLRWRWSDLIPAMGEAGVHAAFSAFWGIPTGAKPDPEEVVTAGTTLWDLHFQGDLAFHLSFDKTFERELDGRLTLGLDLFYEVFIPRHNTTPTGAKHPLLLSNAPYVGETYRLDPGDFSGFSFQIDVAAWRGPSWGNWLSGYDDLRAARLPPLLSLSVRYSFVHLQQSDWSSEYPLWDWKQEEVWRPGYKNLIDFSATFSFFRLGAPLQIYAAYRATSLIPGRNTRAADAVSVGFRIPLKFW